MKLWKLAPAGGLLVRHTAPNLALAAQKCSPVLEESYIPASPSGPGTVLLSREVMPFHRGIHPSPNSGLHLLAWHVKSTETHAGITFEGGVGPGAGTNTGKQP